MLTRRAWIAGLSAAASPVGAGEGLRRAHQADHFVESVGVCTHLESEPYTQHFDTVLRMGASLGVRHIRDEVRPDNDLARWRRLFSEAGIRSHVLASPATNSVAELLAFVLALGPDAISAVEGQNEGDSPWFKAQPVAREGWADVVIGYQRSLFQAVRQHPQTRAIPIVSPSVLDYEPNDMRLLRPAAPFCDIVALHAYLQGQQEPETDDPFAGIGWYLRNMRDSFKPSAPAMVTETGYTTGTVGISAAAAAIYLPRLLLHLFDHGIERSFLYELADESHAQSDPEHNYGLLTPEAAPKPAFHALRRLLGALADPGPAFLPALVQVEIERAPTDLRLVPFRKRDGEIVLALWRAVRVWDPSSRRDAVISTAPIRLRLTPGYVASTLFLTETSQWLAAPTDAGSLEFELGGTAMLLRYHP